MINNIYKLVGFATILAIAAGFVLSDQNTALANDGTPNPNLGRIVVRSNVVTDWTISGPETHSGHSGFASFYVQPSTNDYFISAANLDGFKFPQYLPGLNQTVRAGETVYFDILYRHEHDPILESGNEICDGSWRYLEGRIENDGSQSGVATGWVKNNSKTCFYKIGIASYKMFNIEAPGQNDDWVNNQELYDTITFDVSPGQTIGPDILNVAIPPCRAQIDLFEGIALTPPIYNTPGHFLMDYKWVDKTVCPVIKETGLLVVQSNIPTYWMINGPQNYSGTGTYGSYVTKTGVYTLNDVPATVLYNGKEYALQSTLPQTQTVSPQTSTTYIITYTEVYKLNKPVITGANNNQCGQINLTWQDNSNNESGFRIYRSTQNHGSNLANYDFVTQLATNTTSYVDKPALNKAYYYVVVAYSLEPQAESPSTPYYSAYNHPCTALIDGSSSIIAVNGSSDFNINTLQSGDNITIQVLVDNLGPSSAYVTSISNQISKTMVDVRNIKVTGPNARLSSPALSGSHPNQTMNVSGRKDVGGQKWSITFNATINFSTTSSMQQLSNCSTVNYRDDSGNKTKRICFNEITNNGGVRHGFIFREVAP